MADDDLKTIDDRTVQRLLFVTSDLIGNAIFNYGQELGERVSKLFAIPSQGYPYLDENQQITAMRRQQQLLADTSVASGQSAIELFSDSEEKTIETTYCINHYIVLFFGDIPYVINIDDLNKNNRNIFISKIDIKNRSKDSFTAKSNYLVALKVNFTTFDDLLDYTITARHAYDKNQSIKIAAMHLLYKFFDINIGTQQDRQLPDPTGIFINQTLTLLDKKKYSNTIGVFGPVLAKNYHLTYHKHNIDVFKSDEPINKLFENELTIEYIAYEADGVDKPISKEMNQIIPKVNSNLYNLLDYKEISKSGLAKVFANRKFNERGQVVENDVFYSMSDILGEFKKISNEVDELQRKLNCEDGTVAGKQKDDINIKIEKLRKKLQYLKTYSNRSLIFTILRLCQVYKLVIPANLTGEYEKSAFWENFKQNFSWSDLLTKAGEGALIGVSTTAYTGLGSIAGGVAGAAAGMALYLGVLALGSNQTILVRKDLNITQIRNEVRRITSPGLSSSTEDQASKFAIEPADKFLDIASGKTSAVETTDGSDLAVLNGTSESADKKMKEMMSKLALNALPESSSDVKEIDIFFTTFGELIKILTILDPSRNLRIISGGYTMNIDAGIGEGTYNNFAALPITLNSLSQFLYRMIEQTDRSLNYDSELFFRDCYENLIKAIVNDGQTILPSLQNATPPNIKITSTLHVADNYTWFKNVNLLQEEPFRDFRINFVKTKNFKFADNTKKQITKMYVIGCHQEIKYYDFYKEYNDWVDKNYPKVYTKGNYASEGFQRFIFDNHTMPCILLKNVSVKESILKKKYLNFSRIDNPNLNTGNFINKSGLVRYPYQIKGDFKIFMSFFLDVGSYLFVAPPFSKLENQVNMFGFGGLYIIKSADFEYFFQRIEDGRITIPNLESKYSLDGVMISHGDSIRSKKADVEKAQKNKAYCDIPTVIENDPSAKPES